MKTQTSLAFKGLEKDVFQLSTNTSPKEKLSIHEKIGIEFGQDLKTLVNAKKATPEEIQLLIEKHLGTDNVKVLPITEHPRKKQSHEEHSVCATTKPNYDENLNLIDIQVYLPEIDYSNKQRVLDFVDKTAHEITHVSQFINSDYVSPHYNPSIEGRCMNHVQKYIVDRFMDKGILDCYKTFTKEANFYGRTPGDYDKFLDTPTNKISEEKIREILYFGKNKETQNLVINMIFDRLFESRLKQMNYEQDPYVIAIINKNGGYEKFKTLIKKVCVTCFKDEREAYNVGNIMRKDLNGINGQQTYVDVIPTLLDMYVTALS